MRSLLLLFALVFASQDASAEAHQEFAVEGVIVPGNHTRLDTVHGAVHVWVPEGYNAETATLVVYIHGYFVEVDDAWWAHGLPEQFGAAGINALFVVPESPSGSYDRVRWESITDLALTIEDSIGEKMPKGRRVVIGHSGAYRTMANWLSDPNLDMVVMLDAGYGPHEPFIEWARKERNHRLISLSTMTTYWGNAVHRALGSRVIDDFSTLGPRTLESLSRERLVHVHAPGLDHWQVVTVGLNVTLQMLRAVKLAPAP
ncbi:MAG: hypothetical protein ABI867_03315 [Kofleriaceae bacterium]